MKRHFVKGILLVLVSLTLLGCPKKHVELCPKELKAACGGCDPYLERFEIVTSKLDDKAKLEVKKCVDVTANATIKDIKYADAALKGCISSNTKLDEKVRDALIKQVEEVPIPEEKYKAWLECYKSYLSDRREKPLVVLMDSHIKDVVYCKHTQEIGGSNADDIINLIKNLPVSVATVSTNLEWQDDQRVINLHPALIVLHASAFYEETQAMEGNKRLINFLDSLKDTGIKILVYTRGLPAQPSEGVIARFDAIKKELGGMNNAELFVMPKGHESCFTDPEVGMPFEKKIKEMLAIK